MLPRLSVVIVAASVVLAAAVSALAVPLSWLGEVGSGEPSDLTLNPLARRSIVFAADGSTLATLHGEQNREPVTLEDVPQHVVDAIIAIEDAGFWEHQGVNARGILRAFQANVEAGGISQGGSTITQQVVKLDVLGTEQTLERKTQEIVLARRLEKEMTKEEILTRYLNTVYFGNGAYGIQAAAETYFGTAANELTVDQGALLAGIIQRPATFDPIRSPDSARDRRERVLERMVDLDMLGEDEATFGAALPLPDQAQQVLPPVQDHFAEEVRRRLINDERLGETREDRERLILQGGLRIHTTLDPKAQQQALAARDENIDLINGVFPAGTDPETGEPRIGSAAIVSIEPKNGAVRTMVAGPDFDTSEFNLVTQNRRQVGSSFKTLVAATIMDQGHSPEDQVAGTVPCTFSNPDGEPDPWSPQNFALSGGQVDTIRAQTLRSSNCAYARLGLIAGTDNVRKMANKLGIPAKVGDVADELGLDQSDLTKKERQSPIIPNAISIPLGSADLTPLWMASAYATLANDGVYNEPYIIERVEDHNGNTLFAHKPEPKRAVSPETARLVTSMLQDNVRSGTGTAAAIRTGHPAAGKTGTTNDSTDGWFVGYSRQLATAVWVGGLKEKFEIVLGGIPLAGGNFPATIWGDYMTAWHEGRPIEPLQVATRSGGELLVVPGGRELSDSPTSLEPPEEEEEPEAPDAAVTPASPQPPGQGQGQGGPPPKKTTTTTAPPPSTTQPPPSTTTTSPPDPPGDDA